MQTIVSNYLPAVGVVESYYGVPTRRPRARAVSLDVTRPRFLNVSNALGYELLGFIAAMNLSNWHVLSLRSFSAAENEMVRTLPPFCLPMPEYF